MRENKYRAWDKKLEVMWEGIELTKLLGYLIFQDCPNADAYMALKDHFKDCVWLQYTGLKDKNGKEIYEGDILQIETANHKIIHIVCKGGVIQRKMDTGWLVDIPCFYFERDDGLNSLPIVKNWANKHDLEIIQVIGNIYENPEFIEAPGPVEG